MKCKKHKKYKAVHKPRCECLDCWVIWKDKQAEKVELALKKVYPMPMSVHIKGLKYDLKMCQKQIMEYKKGIQKDGFNSSSITLEEFIEATCNVRQLTFLLETSLTGKFNKYPSGGYDWEIKK